MLLGGRRQDLWVGEIFEMVFFLADGFGGRGGLAVGFGVVLVGSRNVVVLVLCCVNEEWAGWVSMEYCLILIM